MAIHTPKSCSGFKKNCSAKASKLEKQLYELIWNQSAKIVAGSCKVIQSYAERFQVEANELLGPHEQLSLKCLYG